MSTPQLTLIDVPRDVSACLSARLAAFKAKHGIVTHSNRDTHDPGRWVAVKIPPHRLDSGKPLDGIPLWEMFADFGRLLDEGGWTGYGRSQREAIRELCREQGIDCDI